MCLCSRRAEIKMTKNTEANQGHIKLHNHYQLCQCLESKSATLLASSAVYLDYLSDDLLLIWTAAPPYCKSSRVTSDQSSYRRY